MSNNMTMQNKGNRGEWKARAWSFNEK